MATIKTILPLGVFNEIGNHITNLCPNSVLNSWESARSDEDSLTGDFWGGIRRPEAIATSDRSYKWGINYKKIRGKGPDSPESPIGADGIFELKICDELGKSLLLKSFLY